jgi:archaellum biogenesis ATPase FlaH
MFTWINKQGVKSEKGFIVQSVDRFTIEYREASKIISVDVERGFLSDNKLCVNIHLDSFRKWNDGTSIPEEKQKQILQNFIEALKFQDIEVNID